MKVVLFFMLFLACISIAAQNKKPNYFQTALAGGKPTGGLANNYSLGITGSLRYVIFTKPSDKNWLDFTSDVMPYTVSVGVHYFSKKSLSKSDSAIKMINGIIAPIMIGNTFFAEKKYVSFEVGIAFSNFQKKSSLFSFNIEQGFDFKNFLLGVGFQGYSGRNESFLGLVKAQLIYKFSR